jgi:non-specific serine/threonine protein kinase/serine/threonine-protein kinase
MSDASPDIPPYDSGELGRIQHALASTTAAGPHPERIGRYQILERIGEGGMGCVYRAQQRTPIERTVALKLIKAGLDSPQVIRRFESERQALAWMEHPNIAKVLDAGADPVTGRPYFVMEYVSGAPITRYCDEHRLGNRLRLELFLQVCDAVAHAHQKMIVHRDLKPSNILVASSNGPSTAQAKVIDFGLAKAIVSENEQRTLYTESGQIIGTPEYMSPEQARGVLGGSDADIDTRSDIYSLGVVLYELITGALPLDPRELRSSGIAGLERMICDVDPPRPSTRLSKLDESSATKAAEQRQTRVAELRRELKSELEWIPLKALRKDRAERYATANELADDVRNYLAGRPLIAAPESRVYLARKFLKRHKFGVATSAAMVALLLGGIVATTYQAIRANREKRIADARFNDIRNFATNLIGDIHQDVAKLPGSQAAVEKLINIGLQYLQKLNAESSDNVGVVVDASVGYQRMGDLQRNRYANSRIDVKGAAASYQKSLELAQRALVLKPGDEHSKTAMATAQMRLGDIHSDAGDDRTALADYQRAAATLAEVAAGNPADFEARLNALLAQRRIAGELESLDSVADAKTAIARQVTMARELTAQFPQRPEARRSLATALREISEFHTRMGDTTEALSAAKESVTVFEQVSAADPADFRAQMELSESLGNLAHINGHDGDVPAAIEAQTRGLDILKDVRRRDPENRQALRQLATSQARAGDFLAQSKKFDDGERAYRGAISGFRELLASTPDDRQAVRMLLYSQTSLADLFAKEDRLFDAIQMNRDAIATLEPLTKADPKDRALNAGLAFILTRNGRFLLDDSKPEEALETLRRAHDLNVRIAAADPTDAMMGWNVVDAKMSIGDALVTLNRRDEARAYYKQAMELSDGLGSKVVASNQEETRKSLQTKLAALDAPATRPTTAPAGG